MNYVRLGQTGLRVSRLCLGTMTFGNAAEWMIPEEPSRDFIGRALDAGINFFDTADIYSRGESEVILGRALKHFGAAREHVVIATKVFNPMSRDPNDRGLSRKHIMHSIDASLTRLGTDYVDLYQIHRFDPHTPIEETLEALTDVVKAGKALYIGASSMHAWQFAKFLYTADRLGLTRFASMQNHYSLLYREEEREMIPLCHTEGVGVIPWGPLAGGTLVGTKRTGTIRSKTGYGKDRFQRPDDEKVIDTLAQIAERRGEKAPSLALAWMLSKPAITAPIIGVSKPHHLDDALHALEITLTEAEIETLEAPYRPQTIIGHA